MCFSTVKLLQCYRYKPAAQCQHCHRMASIYRRIDVFSWNYFGGLNCIMQLVGRIYRMLHSHTSDKPDGGKIVGSSYFFVSKLLSSPLKMHLASYSRKCLLDVPNIFCNRLPIFPFQNFSAPRGANSSPTSNSFVLPLQLKGT